MQRRQLLLGVAGCLAGSLSRLALAQDYPAREIRFVVPFAAGGGPDVLTRGLAVRLSEVLRRTVFIENKVGAGGIVAAAFTALAPPDGYTLLLGASSHVIQKSMQPGVKFDPLHGFAHITRISTSPSLMVVNAGSAMRSVEDVARAARQSPGKLNYASGGVGSAAHLLGAAFCANTQVSVVHVPYKGSVDIVPSILSGDTNFAFPIASTAIPLLKQGKIRALAVTSAARLAHLPEVPTLREVLGSDDLVVESWSGVWVPAGTPAAIVETLFRALQKVCADPRVVADGEAVGVEISLNASPAEFTAFIRAETAKYARLVKTANLSAT